MANTEEYVSTYGLITNRLEAIKTQNAVLLQEVEQLRHDERKILDFIAKENAVGGLFPAQVEEWLKIKTKYAKA